MLLVAVFVADYVFLPYFEGFLFAELGEEDKRFYLNHRFLVL